MGDKVEPRPGDGHPSALRSSSGVAGNSIARWNGSAWSTLGSGVAPGTALKPPVVRAFMGDALHVGGYFASAGGQPSYGFAIWHPPTSGGPLVGAALLPDGNLVIIWNSLPGGSYQILSTTDLPLPFTPFAGPIPSDGITTSHTNSTTGVPKRFFQIEQLP